MRVSEFIPREKFSQFHEVLISTNGRYLENPLFLTDTVNVVYEPGENHNEAWSLFTEDIVEIYKNQPWRIFLRKFGLRV